MKHVVFIGRDEIGGEHRFEFADELVVSVVVEAPELGSHTAPALGQNWFIKFDHLGR